MSPALPRISGEDVVKALKRDGFNVVSTRGSHQKLRKDSHTVIVPLHKELAIGTLASILRQAGIDADTFCSLLR